MHACICVTWKMYPAGQFNSPLVGANRKKRGAIPASAPLDNRLYHDATPLTGVSTASEYREPTAVRRGHLCLIAGAA